MNYWPFLLLVLSTIFYCEFLGDYGELWKCSWPKVSSAQSFNNKNSKYKNEAQIRAMIIADPHLLGPVRGHWLDRLYREWHMHRTFQTAMTLFRPEIVFVLGDLFDEGEFVNHQQFKEYLQRFHRHFKTPVGTHIISAAGNHDVGFHYKMHHYLTERFAKQFNNTGVHLYTFKEVHFVLINSMAMENDGCNLCEKAQRDLKGISSELNCLKNAQTCKNEKVLKEHTSYSRPILMQHFPTYRVSDKVCKEYDADVIQKYRENWEVLSKGSTDLLGLFICYKQPAHAFSFPLIIGKFLEPRLAFAGHSHDYCLNTNRLGIEEYTVASFSWRNKINPSFLLSVFTASKYAVAKCDMLRQQSVCKTYAITAIIFCCLLIYKIYLKILMKKRKTNEETSKYK